MHNEECETCKLERARFKPKSPFRLIEKLRKTFNILNIGIIAQSKEGANEANFPDSPVPLRRGQPHDSA